MLNRCPACGNGKMNVFYSVENIPVHSVRLLRSRDEAIHFPTGMMDLAHCPACGFVCNLSYQPELQDYSAEYESTQAYSATFNTFARRLAQNLVDRFNLRNKDIIEIGCGQGEFLSLLCEIGDNRGIGFDPAYDPARSALTGSQPIEIIADYYSEKYRNVAADFICCKMTLEHVQDVADFVGIVRRSIGDRAGTTVFFQVPDVDRVLDEVAFWDIYYEHCSYFSAGSLARLFRSQSFDVHDLWRDYGDQYLMIDARPAVQPEDRRLPLENDLTEVETSVARYSAHLNDVLRYWKNTVNEAVVSGKKVVLWGSGSKGVAFLTTLGLCDEIAFTVDINPNKHETYMAGTGQKVVSPQFMAVYRPDLVILMNPLYRQEVQASLAQMGLAPQILSVGE